MLRATRFLRNKLVNTHPNHSTAVFQWLVIGAGPAGIAAVGKLLDHGIPKEQIGWIDPAFQVGDLGQKWRNVPSNTRVSLFLRFLNDCKSFRYNECAEPFALNQLPPLGHCLLNEIALPLQWVTDHLSSSVTALRDEAVSLDLNGGCWEVKTIASNSVRAKNVISCVGSKPRTLPYAHPSVIPLEIALDPAKLSEAVKSTDTIGVFGSSHSAVLTLANLLKLNPVMVHNFYRSPHLYAIHLDGFILFDNTGLKGYAADWARAHLDGHQPSNLKRHLVPNPTLTATLAACDKVIYAVGFDRRTSPVLVQYPDADYQDTVGIIAPGLFGLGIAYPQAKVDPVGNRELRVGLWKFMDYLNTILPIWLKYSN